MSLHPCHVPNISKEVRCGTYEVYEDRCTRSGKDRSQDSGGPSSESNACARPCFLAPWWPGSLLDLDCWSHQMAAYSAV
jgi:hypothetical protein